MTLYDVISTNGTTRIASLSLPQSKKPEGTLFHEKQATTLYGLNSTDETTLIAPLTLHNLKENMGPVVS